MPLNTTRRRMRRRASISHSNECTQPSNVISHSKRRRGATSGSLPRGQTVTNSQVSEPRERGLLFCVSFGTLQGTVAGNIPPNAPQPDPYAHSLSHNLATSKTVEYELGRLVCQALNMVGELVVLNTDRFEIHKTTPPTSTLSMSTIHSTLHQALDQAAAGNTSFTPSSVLGLDDSTPDSLDDTQVQEIGNLFSRNPSALQPIIRRMWYTSNRCPDVSTIISPPSLLVR